ncbi:MAG: molybdenum cofactor biosynthesis protein MoaE [Acidobacteriaceae bacterium]|nr:molybdenum cofactor biosynthesis protein MoaE [Acidobacteriaceae bacterium]
MQVRVLFFGILKDMVGKAEETVQIPPETTLRNLFESYAERIATLRDRRPSILFARNQEFSTPDTVLTEGDEVAFLPPVSGGSGKVTRDPDGHFFSITREVIGAKQLADMLQRPEDGAVVVFEGIVRNNTKGRATTHLEYECYEAMALAQIVRIGREIANQFEIGHIGMVHRVGRLEIGEASVVVVATAPHRKAAFEAAFAGINRLKREVPIWKKEFFADGAVWVDGEWDDRLLADAHTNEAR